MKENKNELQKKVDAVQTILDSIDFEYEGKISLGYGYFRGQSNGSIKDKLKVARRLLLEVSKDTGSRT